jgi:ribonuclease Z
MIDVILLGTGGMMPLADRWLSSLLIRCEGEMTLFDCGEGTQVPMRDSGWGFKRLSSIVLTHLHADHVMGMTGVLFSVGNAGRSDPLTVYGPPGTLAVAQALTIVVPGLPFEVMVHEIEAGERLRLPAGVELTVGAANHRDRCFFYRADRAREPRFDAEKARAAGIPVQLWSPLQRGESIDWDGDRYESSDFVGTARRGVSLGFVTDSRPVPEMTELLRDVDLLVCEGTYGDDADLEKAIPKTHMTFREAATIARGSGAKELWLTHFSPALSDPGAFLGNATEVFPCTTIGYSGLEITLAFQDQSVPSLQ